MRAIILVLALTVSASAQPIASCAPHDEMAATLLDKAKESPVGVGITEEKQLMEMYASRTGTWTIVTTDMTTGTSCIKAYGRNYHGMAVPPNETVA